MLSTLKDSYIESIEFNFDFYPDTIERNEIATEIFENKMIRQKTKLIEHIGNKVMYYARIDYKGITIPYEYFKGVIVNIIST